MNNIRNHSLDVVGKRNNDNLRLLQRKRKLFQCINVIEIQPHNTDRKCECFTPFRIAGISKTQAFCSAFGG